MKRIEKAALMGLAICFLMAAGGFHSACNSVRQQTLRLHVLANSDSEADQNLKLAVRDAVLAEAAALFSDADSREEAEEIAQRSLPKLRRAARDALQRQGSDYSVSVNLGDSDFATREYQGGTLPAGSYRSLIVTIGEGDGRNWWCVLYPAICIGASSAEEDPLLSYSRDARVVVTGYGEYRLGFYLEEVYHRLKSAYRSSAS